MWSKLKNYFQIDLFFTYVLVPLFALFLYFSAFSLLSARFSLDGVNVVFVNRMWRYLLILVCIFSLVFSLIFIYFVKIRKIKDFQIIHRREKISISDLLLLLLPLTPVVQYIFTNLEILSLTEALTVLTFFAFFSALFIIVIPLVLGNFGSTRTMMALGLALVFTITNMASLTNQFNWLGVGSIKIQGLFFGGVFIISWILTKRQLKRTFYLLIIISFAASTAFQWLSQSSAFSESSSTRESQEIENNLKSLVEGRQPVVSPNVYLLVFDSYVANETMLGYGIDNSPQEAHLIAQGFTLYPHTYSVGAFSIATMSRVLNAAPQYYGNIRNGVSGNGVVHSIFKDNGYLTYGIFSSDFFFRGVGSSYDLTIPDQVVSSDKLLIEAILIGEFKFDIGFEDMSQSDFAVVYQNQLTKIPNKPIFVYMHSSLPGHSQNSGVCRPDEIDRYEEKLSTANLEMKELIQSLIEQDPSAIIIIAGDHGPYLTKNCNRLNNNYDKSDITRLDIQDRYGTFLAIRWPTDNFDRFDEIVVLQDLFPAIFSYLYGDESILESKIAPVTMESITIGDLKVNDGIIIGGPQDNEPLFLFDR